MLSGGENEKNLQQLYAVHTVVLNVAREKQQKKRNRFETMDTILTILPSESRIVA
jgi:hypothetical protein